LFANYLFVKILLTYFISTHHPTKESKLSKQAQQNPLHDCTFIHQNMVNQMPVQHSKVTKEGNVRRKREVLAATNLKVVAQRRDIA
jgi:hypothetical protein